MYRDILDIWTRAFNMILIVCGVQRVTNTMPVCCRELEKASISAICQTLAHILLEACSIFCAVSLSSREVCSSAILFN